MLTMIGIDKPFTSSLLKFEDKILSKSIYHTCTCISYRNNDIAAESNHLFSFIYSYIVKWIKNSRNMYKLLTLYQSKDTCDFTSAYCYFKISIINQLYSKIDYLHQ